MLSGQSFSMVVQLCQVSSDLPLRVALLLLWPREILLFGALSPLFITNIVSPMFNTLGMNVYCVEFSFRSEKKKKSAAILSVGTILLKEKPWKIIKFYCLVLVIKFMHTHWRKCKKIQTEKFKSPEILLSENDQS